MGSSMNDAIRSFIKNFNRNANLMLLTLMVALLINLSRGYCVFTENYWRNRQLDEWPISLQNKTLCNQSWSSLLHHHHENRSLWNRTFREICVTNLNNFTTGIERGEEILKGMEGMCGDEVRWRKAWEIVLPRMMDEIQKYNRGLFTGHPLCPLTNSPSIPSSSTTNGIVKLREDDTNDFKFYILVLVLLTIFIVPLLVILTKKNIPRS